MSLIGILTTLSEKNFNGQLLTKFKNINYEVQNVNEYKPETTSELFGALGYPALTCTRAIRMEAPIVYHQNFIETRPTICVVTSYANLIENLFVNEYNS